MYACTKSNNCNQNDWKYVYQNNQNEDEDEDEEEVGETIDISSLFQTGHNELTLDLIPQTFQNQPSLASKGVIR